MFWSRIPCSSESLLLSELELESELDPELLEDEPLLLLLLSLKRDGPPTSTTMLSAISRQDNKKSDITWTECVILGLQCLGIK